MPPSQGEGLVVIRRPVSHGFHLAYEGVLELDTGGDYETLNSYLNGSCLFHVSFTSSGHELITKTIRTGFFLSCQSYFMVLIQFYLFKNYIYLFIYYLVCVCARVCVYVCVCAHASVHTCNGWATGVLLSSEYNSLVQKTEHHVAAFVLSGGISSSFCHVSSGFWTWAIWLDSKHFSAHGFNLKTGNFHTSVIWCSPCWSLVRGLLINLPMILSSVIQISVQGFRNIANSCTGIMHLTINDMPTLTDNCVKVGREKEPSPSLIRAHILIA